MTRTECKRCDQPIPEGRLATGSSYCCPSCLMADFGLITYDTGDSTLTPPQGLSKRSVLHNIWNKHVHSPLTKTTFPVEGEFFVEQELMR